MAAPADDEIRPDLVIEHARIAQDVEHRVGDRFRIVEIESAAVDDFVRNVDDVPQHGEQQLLDAADHLAIDERRSGRVLDLELHAPGVAHDLDIEVAIAIEDLFGVVDVAAGVQHGERALAEQRIQATLPARQQLFDFFLRQALERAARPDTGVDELGYYDAGFHRGIRCQGWISIGVLSDTSIQTSTISAFETAMQPSVQSCVEYQAKSLRGSFGRP